MSEQRFDSFQPADAKLVQRLTDLLGPTRVSSDSIDRLVYARDFWPRELLELRNGRVRFSPEAVVWPETTEEVVGVLEIARETGTPVTPVSASSGVCGGATPVQGGIVVDMKRMDRWRAIDKPNLTVTVGPGVIGQDYEDRLNRNGLTGGHFPSSMYCSSVGGWINTRAAGQLSSKYGVMKDLVVGLEAVLADGTVIRTLDMPNQAAGPDFNQMMIGSEGTLGIVTEATLRVFPYPEKRIFQSFMFKSVKEGLEGVRRILQTGVRPAVCRLYDEMDTMLTMQALGNPMEGILLMLSYEGEERLTQREAEVGAQTANEAGGKDIGDAAARYWWGHRYKISYQMSLILKNPGMINDTIEVTADWNRIDAVYDKMREALKPYAVVLAHFSHAYPDGINIYFSLVGQATPGEEPQRYDAMWKAAMDACVGAGGAISHHHGIGILKAPWMEANHGGAMRLYRGLKQSLDPTGYFNPGKMGL